MKNNMYSAAHAPCEQAFRVDACMDYGAYIPHEIDVHCAAISLLILPYRLADAANPVSPRKKFQLALHCSEPPTRRARFSCDINGLEALNVMPITPRRHMSVTMVRTRCVLLAFRCVRQITAATVSCLQKN